MSDRGYWKVSTAYAFTYILKDSTGTGITGRAGSLVTVMAKDDSYVTSPTVTITEIDATHLPGWYKVAYTPVATGHYVINVTDPSNDTDGWVDEVQVVNRVNDDFAYPASSGQSLAVDGSGEVTVGTNNDKTGYALTVGERTAIATAVWALANAIDGTLTPQQAVMYIFAAVAGVSSGEPGPGTDSFEGPSGTVRLTTTFDSNNNRTGVALS